jgi:hypothetical protein
MSPDHSMKTLVLAALAALALAGCTGPTHDDPHGPPADSEEEIASTVQPVTCAASVARYPVAGVHNNGWDQQWYNFACVSNGTTTIFNSDFIAGQHIGNDIFAPRGTPVQAAVDGWVPNNFWNSVGGNVVYVQDNCGWTHYYAHLDSVSITGNRWVSAGTILGTVGNTGSAANTAPHLHYSIYPDGVYANGIDPAPLTQPVEGTACGAPTPPAKPTGLSPDGWVNVGSSSAYLTWNAASGATSYDVVKYYWDGAQWLYYYTWNTSNTYFQVWPVYHDRYYAWAVVAKNGSGSTWSDWAYYYFD